MRRIPACLAALAIALLPLAAHAQGTTSDGSHWQAVAPEGSHWQFVAEEPLGKGLHLLAGTSRTAYGNLTELSVTPAVSITVPVSVDLSQYSIPVGDQAYIGSCTSWAASYSLVGWWLNKEGLYDKTGPMAPMYTYHQVNGGADNGSWAYLNLNADMAGMVPMSQYPQGNYNWKAAPSGTQMALAHQVKIKGGMMVYQYTGPNPDPGSGEAPATRAELMNGARYQLEWALAHDGPVDLELTVRSLMDNATPQTAYVPLDPSPVLGGHDLVAVGYDQYGLWVQNQWGTGWGLNGYAELSWDYVLDNVEGGYVINGVSVAPSFRPAPVYRGTPSMTLTATADGVPTGDSVLHKDQEEVFVARGLRPGDVVREYVDGQYRQYMTAAPAGTVSDEIYWHPETGKEGPHAVLFTPGWHTVKVVDQHGDWASAEMQVG